MTQDILNFLTGGVFTTLKELILNILNYVVLFANNLISIVLSPLINQINGSIPNIDSLVSGLNYVFDYVSPYINFILDLTFLSSPILIYLIASLIFRIVLKTNTYFVKVLIQWYEKLVP